MCAKRDHENIFETTDNVMRHLYLSKKIFLIMIVTGVIFPPSLMVGSSLAADYLQGERSNDDSPRLAKLASLVDQLEKGEISPAEYVEEARYVKDATRYGGPGFGYYMWWTIISIFVFWICYGAIQWMVLRKHSNRYIHSKTIQEEIIAKNRLDADKIKTFKDVFEIADNAIHNLNTTKKMFLIVVVVGFLVPQLLPLAHIALVVQPVQGPIVAEFESLIDQLENNEISVESFAEKFRILKSEYTAIMGMSDSVLFGIITMFANALFWTGYGIRQWLIHTKWNKRYDMFNAKDEEISRKLLGE